MTLPGIEVRKVERCGSTNAVLLAEGKPDVLLAADEQTAGRGRRGRRWYSAPGAGITFSLSVRIQKPVAGLSLVAGVGAARALRAMDCACCFPQAAQHQTHEGIARLELDRRGSAF